MNGIRTVRNGRIKLNNRWWGPEQHHQAYDGRLDGLRFLFMQYSYPTNLVALWGTAAAARGESGPEPELVDGFYPWYFWHSAEEET